MDGKALVELEEQFWKGDADFYQANVAEDALFVFSQPVGVLNKQQSVEAIANSERWAEVTFDDVHVVQISSDVAMIVYEATAESESGSRYSALASSVYVERNGSTLLVLHQQSTPTG